MEALLLTFSFQVRLVCFSIWCLAICCSTAPFGGLNQYVAEVRDNRYLQVKPFDESGLQVAEIRLTQTSAQVQVSFKDYCRGFMREAKSVPFG